MVRVTRLAVAVVVLGLLAGCSGGDGSGPADEPAAATSSATSGDDESHQPTDDDREQITTLLKTRARALELGDREAFLATVDPADEKLVKQQTTLYENLQLLPVESVAYSVDAGAGYPTADIDGDDPLFRPEVIERVRLDVDTRPVSNTLENTFVQRDGTWLLGAESVPGRYRDDREPQSRPWAGSVPIAVARSGRLLVVTDRDGEVAAQSLADDIARDIRSDADALGIEPTYAVLVDATTVGEAHQMNSVDDVEAAAVTYGVGSFTTEGGGQQAGVRIKVNPDTAAEVARDDRVMRHELTHFLTLETLAGAPTWVKEGLAEWTSTAPATLDELVVDADAYAHVMDVRRRLPTGGRWGLDPRADYLIGRAAVSHLVEEFGPARVLALGAAYRRIPGDDPDEKTDRILRRVLGISERVLVNAAWAELATLQRG